MENCKKHSKLLCSQCRHYDYCDIAKRCDGICYNCDITDCENNSDYKGELKMKTFKLPTHENMEFTFRIDAYTTTGNTYVGIDSKEDDLWEPFADLTVNLDMVLDSNQAFIYINNLDDNFIKGLEEQGFISNTGLKKQSGFVLYPLYTLNLDKIKEYCNDN